MEKLDIFYFVGYNSSLCSSAHEGRLIASTKFKEEDRKNNIFHILGYLPIIGTISAIVRLVLFSNYYSNSRQDRNGVLQTRYFGLLSHLEFASFIARFSIELFSFGFLLIIPDIFATAVRGLNHEVNYT